jgi:hypothetical protein
MRRINLLVVLCYFLFFFTSASSQQINPRNLPQCPPPDVSKTVDIGGSGRTHKWHYCWGRYEAELPSNFKGDVYEGEWLNGTFNGLGTYNSLANNQFKGAKYVGEHKDGKYNGHGIYTFANGNKYVGQFKDSKKHGQGILTTSDGRRLEGFFENDKFLRESKVNLPDQNNGVVVNTDRIDIRNIAKDLKEKINPGALPSCAPIYNGLTLELNFEARDKCWGRDFFTLNFDFIYDKEIREISVMWKDGKPSGIAHIVYSSGDQYTGNTFNGKKYGVGHYKYLNGDEYFGEFSDGNFNGQGIYLKKNNSISEGIWERDKLVRETKVDLVKLKKYATANIDGTKIESIPAEQREISPGLDKDAANNIKFSKIGHDRSDNTGADNTNQKLVEKTNPNDLPLCQKNATKLHNCWGTRVYGDSSKYVGEFKDDNRHGQGVFTQVNGSYFEGIWENDNLKHAKTIRVGSTDNVTARSDKSQVKREQVGRAQKIMLEISNTDPVNDGSFTLSIKTNADTASLLIDGKEEGGRADGNYTIKRVARAGQTSSFKIVATDVYGNTDTKTIMVNRVIVESKVNYTPLNPAQVKRQTERDAVAIIIGISNYKTLPKADFANDDARVFYDYAIRALGVKPENIKLLVDQDAEEVEIIKAFKTWLPSRVKSTTDVYVYYSGHGLPTQDGQGLYLLPPRADRDFISRTSIQFQEINSDLQAAKPKSVTIFMDACYSGQARSGETLVANARPVALKAEKKLFPDNFTVITASQADQISSSSPDLKHGIFSYYLMKGMEGDADANKDGKITLGEMQAYLVENVGRQAGMMSRKQEPQLIGDAGRVLVGVSSK